MVQDSSGNGALSARQANGRWLNRQIGQYGSSPLLRASATSVVFPFPFSQQRGEKNSVTTEGG